MGNYYLIIVLKAIKFSLDVENDKSLIKKTLKIIRLCNNWFVFTGVNSVDPHNIFITKIITLLLDFSHERRERQKVPYMPIEV